MKRTNRRKRSIALAGLALLLGALAVAAQEPSGPYVPVRRDEIGTRLVSLASPYPTAHRTLEVLFTHRFRQTVNDGDSHDLWGLDGGSDVGIGVSAGVAPHLDLALYRASFQETFELAGKFLVWEQARRVPLTVALRGGIDHLRRPGAEDPDRPFAQIVLARRFRPGVNLVVAPSWVRGTPRLRNAFNVPLGLTLPLGRGRLIEIEFVPRNRDIDASVEAWSLALSKSLGSHVFELTLGNSRATTLDQTLGGDFAGGFRRRDVRLGFNIVRDFRY